MLKNMIKFLGLFALIASVLACSVTPVDNNIAATNPPDEEPAAADTISIVSTDPTLGVTLSPTDMLTVTVHYKLASAGTGYVSVWLEKFLNPQCSGEHPGSYGSFMTGREVSGGDQEITLTLPMVPFETSYAAVGANLTSDPLNTTVFAEDLDFDICFATSTATIGEPPALTDSIQFVSIDPPAASGLRATDTTVTAVIQVDLASAAGDAVMFFERYHDAACTQTGIDPSGNSTMASSEYIPVVAGNQQVTFNMAVPPLDIEYVGVGFQVWSPGRAGILAELYYPVCYQVMY